MSEEQQQRGRQGRNRRLQAILQAALDLLEDQNDGDVQPPADDEGPPAFADEIEALINMELAEDNPLNLQRLVRRLRMPNVSVQRLVFTLPNTEASEAIQMLIQDCRNHDIEVETVLIDFTDIPPEAQAGTIRVFLNNSDAELTFHATIGRALDRLANRIESILTPRPLPSRDSLVGLMVRAHHRGQRRGGNPPDQNRQ